MASGIASSDSAKLPKPPTGKFVDYGDFIDGQLRRTRSQVKAVEVTGGLLLFLLGTLGLFVLAALADHWIIPGGLGLWGRLLFFAVFVAGAGYLLVKSIVPALFGRVNPVYAAHTIERSKPTLKNTLINFLLFRRHRDEVSTVVFSALEEQAATGLARTPIDAAVDRTRLIHLGYALIALLSVLALYFLLSPKNPLTTIGRVMVPWADIPAPARVNIADVRPGNATAFRGQGVEISAEVIGLGSGDDVKLIYSTADRQTVDRALVMRLPRNSYRHTGTIPDSAEGVQQDIEYRIEAGDAVSARYSIQAVAAPAIVIDSVDYRYPAYTGIEPATSKRGDLKALEGTQVTLRAVANQPIKSAAVDFNCDGKADRSMRVDGQTATLTFDLALNADRTRPEYDSYQVRFVNADNAENPQPIRHRIEVVPDLGPEIDFLAPQQEEVSLPLDSSLPLEVRAIDPDFALARVALEAKTDRGGLLDKTTGQLLTATPHRGPFVGKFDFSPGKFKLREGDVVRYRAVAADNKDPNPNAVGTTERRIRIVAAQNPNPQRQQDQQAGKSGNDGQPQPQNQQQPPRDQQQQQPNQAPQQGDPQKQDQQPGAGQDNTGKSEQNKQSQDQQRGDRNQQQGNQKQQSDGQGQQQQQNNAGQRDQQDKQSGQGQNNQSNDGQNKQNSEQGQGKQSSGGQQQQGQQQQGQQQQGQQQQGQQGQGKQRQGQQGQGRQGQGQQQSSQQQGGSAQGSKGDQGQQDANGNQQGQRSGDRQPAADQQPSAQQGGQPSAQQGGQRSRDRSAGKPGEGSPTPADGSDDGRGVERLLQDREKSAAKEQSEQQPAGKSDAREQSGKNDQPAGQAKGTGRQPPADGPDQQAQKSGDQPGDKQPADKQTGDKQPGDQGNRDRMNGDSPSQDASQKGQGGQDGAKSGSQPKDQAKSDNRGEKPTDKSGEGQQPNQSADQPNQGASGAGGDKSDSKGSPSTEQAQKSTGKQPGANEPQREQGEGEQSPSNSQRESKSRGQQDGDRSGGGNKGGGQSSKQPGTGGAGQTTPDDQGTGAADEPGKGELSNKPGDDQKANQRTGKSGQEQGKGTSTRPAGDSAGKSDKPADQQPGDDAEQPSRPGEQQAGKGQDNRQQSPSGQPGAPGQPRGGQPIDNLDDNPVGGTPTPVDDPNLDYARKATELAVDHLKDAMSRPDGDRLLKELGWTRDEARQFIERQERRLRGAEQTGDDPLRREAEDALRSLGLRPTKTQRAGADLSSDQQRGLSSGRRTAPPPDYAEQFRAYSQGVNQGSGQ